MFEKHRVSKQLRAYVETLVAPDGSISEEGCERFDAYCDEHGISGADMPPDVLNTLRLGLATGGSPIEVGTTLLVKRGEVAYCEEAAALLKEVAQREFRGGSRGVSVPLGHGVRYRAGAVRGRMVTIGTEWQIADTGLLTVTNRRAVYHGGRKTLEFAFAKLATLNAYSDAIDLGVTSRQSTSSFRVEDPHFVAGMIHAAFSASNAESPA